MNTVIKDLELWGCDIQGALERFIGDEELYVSCLHSVINDPAYDKLGDALDAGNAKEAFEYAHTLKGVLANMGLTPIYDIDVLLVEPLRAGKCERLMPIYQELLQANEKLKGMLANA